MKPYRNFYQVLLKLTIYLLSSGKKSDNILKNLCRFQIIDGTKVIPYCAVFLRGEKYFLKKYKVLGIKYQDIPLNYLILKGFKQF